MTYYAKISNEEFTVSERARLLEVEKEINVIRQDNIESKGYQLLYSTLHPTVTQEDIMNEVNLQYPEGDFTPIDVITISEELHDSIYKSDTLQTLEGELAALESQRTPEMTQEEKEALNTSIAAKQAEIDAEKEKLAQDVAEIQDQLHELEYNNTEDLVPEIDTLNTAIANALCRVKAMYTGADEIVMVAGDSSAIQAEIKALEDSKRDIDYTQDQEVWMAEVEAIQVQIRAKQEEMNAVPQVEKDNTVYWEGYYGGCKRTSYNTQGGVHKLGGTPFRKNYAGVRHIYDPVRDAFYTEQPFASWTLDESTCCWQPPTPRPEEGVWYWKEDTTEWVDYVYINPDNNQPYPSWIWDTTTGGWSAPLPKPEDGLLYIWNEETLTWVER